MSELNVAGIFLNALTDYGPWALGLAALLAALGLPLPTPVLLLAGGALVRQGLWGPAEAVLAWLAGCALGDSAYYVLGWYAGAWVVRRLSRLWAGFASAWAAAQTRFGQGAAWTIYLTRWLITPLGLPTTLAAGSSRYAYGRFLTLAAAGDLMWVLTYGLAGYVVGEQWPAIGAALGRYGGYAALTALAAGGAYALYRLARRRPVLPATAQ